MSIQPWKVVETNYFRPRFRIDKCELSNGNFLDATIFEFRSWANVVALTKRGEVVLVKQYRHGVEDVLWEFPGGVVEDGEDPLDAGEDIEVDLMPLDKLIEMARRGEFPHALMTAVLFSTLSYMDRIH